MDKNNFFNKIGGTASQIIVLIKDNVDHSGNLVSSGKEDTINVSNGVKALASEYTQFGKSLHGWTLLWELTFQQNVVLAGAGWFHCILLKVLWNPFILVQSSFFGKNTSFFIALHQVGVCFSASVYLSFSAFAKCQRISEFSQASKLGKCHIAFSKFITPDFLGRSQCNHFL